MATKDNEAIVRRTYHTAEGNVLDIAGWVGSFTEDGVFNNVILAVNARQQILKTPELNDSERRAVLGSNAVRLFPRFRSVMGQGAST